MVRCITFDLDDTLWDIRPTIDRAERAFFDWCAEHHPEVVRRFSLAGLTDHRRRFYGRHPHMRHDLTWLRRHWLSHLAERIELGTGFIDPAFDIYWEHRNRVELFPGAPELLGELAGSVPLGVITNGNACVRRIGIGEHFRFVVAAGEVGAAKPDRRIFDAAVERAGEAPQHILHVGDDPEKDVAGALRCGLRAVWFNPSDQPWPGGARPEATVASLGELRALLAEMLASD